MVLPTTGPLSLQDVQGEFGGTNPISLSEYYAIGKDIPASGQISIDQFYGGIDTFSITISSNQANLNLRSYAVSAGWDEYAKLLVTIASGVIVYASSTSLYALTINGSYQRGVTLVNNGTIVGMGGAAGAGGSGPNGSGGAGAGGGPALLASSAASIQNNGIIGGGGGGGGGGGAGFYFSTNAGGGGGGGGRTGLTNSSGGAGGSPNGGAGGTGTFSSGGGGGAGAIIFATHRGGNGGAGGSWGAAGAAGQNGRADGSVLSPPFGFGGAGGAAGVAVQGNGNVTWLATGTILGAQV